MAELRYCVSTQFDPLPGFSSAINLGALKTDFSLSEADLEPIRCNQSSFNKSGLHHLVAQELMRAFQRAGIAAVMKVERVTGETENVEIVPNGSIAFMTHCPKCDAEVNNKTECSKCGIYFDKIFNGQASLSGTDLGVDSAREEDDPVDQAVAGNAQRFLGVAAALYITQFTLDGKLGYILFKFLSSDIDHGNVCFVLGTLFLAVGCSFVAKTKGYHPVVGIVGLTSLPGLSIVLLLKNRNSDDQQKLFSANRLSAIGFLIISVLWYSSYNTDNTLTNAVLQQAGLLSSGRHQYPSEVLDPMDTSIRSEVRELRKLINSVSDHLSSESIGADNAALIVDELMQQSAELLVWIDYQHYLHTRANPDQLGFVNKNELELKILDAIRQLKKGIDLSDFNNESVLQAIYENLRGEAGNKGKSVLQQNREALLGTSQYSKTDQINEALYLVTSVIEADGRTGRWDRDTSYSTRREELQKSLSELPNAIKVNWSGNDTVTIDIDGNWMPNRTDAQIIIKYFATAFTKYNQLHNKNTCTIVFTNFPNKFISSKSTLNAFDINNLIQYPM